MSHYSFNVEIPAFSNQVKNSKRKCAFCGGDSGMVRAQVASGLIYTGYGKYSHPLKFFTVSRVEVLCQNIKKITFFLINLHSAPHEVGPNPKL